MGKHGKRYDLSPTEAKAELIKLISQGHTVEYACGVIHKSVKTYEYYRRSDKEFSANIDYARLVFSGQGRRPVGEFPEWSEKYLGHRVFWHQQQWVDLLEGRKPRDLHPAQIYRPGEPDLIICNTPPEHAKSTTITVNYTTYRICDDPNIRVIIISKTQDLAKKFLYAIKTRLTHPRFQDLQAAYAPAGGFKGEDSDGWRQDAIYLSGQVRDSGEKDPTIQALGIRGHVYGQRADLIIMDDCVDSANAHEHEKQIDWLQGEVLSRLGPEGRLLLVGTRMSPQDLYSEVQNPDLYPDERSPWTYFAQPAVLEFTDSQEDWVTLWPRSNVPEVAKSARLTEADEDGLYPKWNGPRLAAKRARMSPRKWSMVYMQEQVAEDAIFTLTAIKGCTNGNRRPGLMPKGVPRCRKEGMDGLYIVAGLDPAMTGHTAAVVLGVDRQSRKRYVLDVHNQAGMTPDDIRNLIRRWTEKYAIQEWRVEKNAFQLMLTQDRQVREYLASRGCILKEHFTGSNKWDVDFGVASMASLFEGYDDKPPRNLIELPSSYEAEGVKALIEQLAVWHPDAPKVQKTDAVMALWFAEIRARELCDSFFGLHHAPNRYRTGRQEENCIVVDLDELLTRRHQEGLQGRWAPAGA